MFTLTRQEKILIVCLMASLLLGATVKHWRELRGTSFNHLAPASH